MENLISRVVGYMLFIWLVVSIIAAFLYAKTTFYDTYRSRTINTEHMHPPKHRFIKQFFIVGQLFFLVISTYKELEWLISIVNGGHIASSYEEIIMILAVSLIAVIAINISNLYNEYKKLKIDSELYYSFDRFYYDMSDETLENSINSCNKSIESYYEQEDTTRTNFLGKRKYRTYTPKEIHKLQVYYSMADKLRELQEKRRTGDWKE